MGYNKAKAKPVYQPMRSMTTFSPAMHEAFRREWEANFESAIEKAMQLAKQGFLVEECLQKGAMMESKAKRLSEQLEKQGFTVELIPIARWGKEQAVFLIYKPPEKPPEPEPPKPTKQPTKPITREEIIEAFQKTFTYKPSRHIVLTPDPTKLQTQGFIPDPPHNVALIDPDANSTEALVVRARSSRQERPDLKIANSGRLRGALTKLQTQNKRFVSLGPGNFQILYLKKALKVLGDGPLHVYFGRDNLAPVIFMREEPPHLAIAIAPYVDPDPHKVATIHDVVEAMSKGVK